MKPLQVFDAATRDVHLQQVLPQDVGRMAWAGEKPMVALADGTVLGLEPK